MINKQILKRHIGRELKKIRQSRDYTQKEMAHLLMISQPKLSLIESGKLSLSAQQMFFVIERFNLQPNHFTYKRPSIKDSDLLKQTAKNQHVLTNEYVLNIGDFSLCFKVYADNVVCVEINLFANNRKSYSTISHEMNVTQFEDIRNQIAKIKITSD